MHYVILLILQVTEAQKNKYGSKISLFLLNSKLL